MGVSHHQGAVFCTRLHVLVRANCVLSACKSFETLKRALMALVASTATADLPVGFLGLLAQALRLARQGIGLLGKHFHARLNDRRQLR